MFCKYCGKESGSEDVCAECKDKNIKSDAINEIIDRIAVSSESNIAGQKTGTAGNYSMPVGFRTNTTWKKIVAICYYIYVAYAVIHMYNIGEYGWYDGFCTYMGFFLPVEIFKSFTDKNSKINQWLFDKGGLVRAFVNFGKVMWIMLWFCILLVIAKAACYKITLDTCLPGLEYLIFEDLPIREYYNDDSYNIDSFAIVDYNGSELIDEDCLLKAEAVLIEDYGDTYYILLDFNENGKYRFTELINENRLGELIVALDGKPLFRIADFPMVNDYAVIDNEFNKNDADLFVALINKLIL